GARPDRRPRGGSQGGCRGRARGRRYRRGRMKRTSVPLLILLAVLGGGVSYLIDHLLTVSGRATFAPSGFLPVLLLLLAAAVLAVAWPVRRSVRGMSRGRIDPFRALRAATLARASS